MFRWNIARKSLAALETPTVAFSMFGAIASACFAGRILAVASRRASTALSVSVLAACTITGLLFAVGYVSGRHKSMPIPMFRNEKSTLVEEAEASNCWGTQREICSIVVCDAMQ